MILGDIEKSIGFKLRRVLWMLAENRTLKAIGNKGFGILFYILCRVVISMGD